MQRRITLIIKTTGPMRSVVRMIEDMLSGQNSVDIEQFQITDFLHQGREIGTGGSDEVSKQLTACREALKKYGKHLGPTNPHGRGFGCPAACSAKEAGCGQSHHCVCGLSDALPPAGGT